MANFFGDMYDNILTGGPDDDVLWGEMGDDELSGGAGDDRLIGGPGADALNGGSGMDVASYTDSTRGVHVNLGTSFSSSDEDAPVRGGDAEGDSLTSIESIWGSEFADMLIGSHASNYLFGNGGNDHIDGGRGSDHLRGGHDDDVVMGGAGADVVYGDMGIDDVMGGSGNDMLFGGMGDDFLTGGAGDDMLEGGSGADQLAGGYWDEDDMYMDTGSDTASYTMSDAAVTIDLSKAMDDPMNGEFATNNPQAPYASGGDADGDMFLGIDNIRGSMYADMLIGDEMPNKIWGNQGDDTIKGGDELGDNPATTDDPGTTDTVENVETDFDLAGDTIWGGKGDDTIYALAGNDMLMGDMGDDKLKGGSGNDTLMGGEGADVLLGGTLNAAGMFEDDGNDTADYSESSAGVTIDLSKTPRGQMPDSSVGEGGDAEGDILHGIENLTGSMHTDLLIGNGEANMLMGMGGDDWNDPMTPAKDGGLYGGAGDDTIDGGDGADSVMGEGGVDLLMGGKGNDYLHGGDDNDANNDGPDGNADTADDVMGGLMGGDGDDTLDGGGGNDSLMGEKGNDVLKGSAGDDTLDGGEGNDTVDYSAITDGTVDITIDLSADGDQTTGGIAAGDVLMSIENVVGGAGDDAITGNDMANVLMGGDGRDTLEGGGGADTFVFGTEMGLTTDDAGTTDVDEGYVPANADRVTDFSSRQGDMLDLSAYGLDDDDLDTILENADIDYAAGGNPDWGGTGQAPVVALDLRSYGGGVIMVTLESPVATLDADDFII